MTALFLFGFSRGAYTVRVLAGLLHTLGLAPRGGQNLVPYVLRLFKAIRGTEEDDASQRAYWRLCKEFRWTFARAVGGREDRRFPVHFLGIWDTVSSVGWVRDPLSFPHTARNPSIAIVRHAVSLDERRCFYRQNLMHEEPAASPQDLEQRWFSGVHSDVGGGYPEAEGDIWRRPFEWILQEATQAGLLVDRVRKDIVLQTGQPGQWKTHESLRGWWWLAEFYPKRRWSAARRRHVLRLGLGRFRHLVGGERIDRSVLEAIRERQYAPKTLTPSFLTKVRALTTLPEALPYEP